VACNRSAESVVGILAAYAAGAAYLPLDLDQPRTRLANLIQDARPRLAVSVPGASEQVVQSLGIPVVASTAGGPAAALPEPVETDAASPAYVLFTSGSTGRPKGVVMSRHALGCMVAWHLAHPRYREPARVLQFVSLGFDPSVRDIFVTLATGGSLILAGGPERRDPFRLLQLMQERGVERVSLPYPMLRALAEAHAEGGARPAACRDMVSGGEALVVTPAIRRLFVALPGAVLHNEYGPTETCVFATAHALADDPAQWPERPAIGLPLAHVRLHVVDERMQPVPDGVEGELLIGGDGVADGYIGQPRLTAEKFVRVELDGASARVYRSGDRVVRHADGQLTFVGRVDDQVKVAGHRVEPGEVEAVLAAHAAARDVAVVAVVAADGAHLVAHVVLADGATVADGRMALDRHLAEHVASFARPQRWVFHAALPLTPNGKVDRRKLAAESLPPGVATPVSADAPLEERVAALWRELLMAPGLGIDGNVFDHGADSLSVMGFVTRWRARSGAAPGAAMIYQQPTPRQQARMLASLPPAGSPAAAGGALGGRGPVPTELPLEVPLSSGQMEKWFASQFGELASLSFVESSVLQLDGVLDRSAIRQALEQVWQRHESLRFSFTADGASQRFNADVALPLVETEPAAAAGDVDAWFDACCEQRIRQPFDLSVAPLVRFSLVRLGERRHALHIVAHHLVMDGWSLAIFVGELGACYSAIVAARAPVLAPAASFRRYLLDELARRTTGAAASLDYWRQVYETPPATLRLPSDRPAPLQPDYAAGTVRHELSPALTNALRCAARQRGVSLYSLLLSGFGVLLARLSGQHDFAVAVPFAGLALTDGEALMGDGVSALPLRLRVGPELPFSQLVDQTHASLLDATAHRDATLTDIQRMLGLRATDGEAALTGITFNMLPKVPPVAFDGLSHTLRECPRVAMDWDLGFNVSDTGDALALDLHFATARHDAGTMRRWLAFYEVLLSGVVGEGGAATVADTAVADIDLLGAAGRTEVLEAWNATDSAYDREQGVTALIEARMRQMPQRIAAECGGETIDYAALDRATRALARALARRGIGRGDLVGVCVPRSLQMLLAVVGVLRSGAAYVPLDPEFPADRLHYMAEHSGLRHVLVTRAGSLPPTVAAERTLLDVDALIAETADGVLPVVRGSDLAYVLYTSGSTGKPKGVRITHRNLVNFLLGMSREPGFGADDVLCAVTTLSFDIAGLELYLPLIVGARLVIATEEEYHEPQPLWDLVERSGCNVLQTTPSLLRLLMDTGREAAVRDLRLFVGGEALPLEVANSMAGRCREFWNLYGPTETTIWSTIARIRPGLTVAPLGKPIANTRIYVLDPQNRPVLPGLIGEIWIGGDGVADGYLHRPDLTAERFLADPFAGGGARMYRTGDLGAWRDGVLHFHGRADHQIKIRGYRIEPGDIEAAADGHPAVSESVVVVRQFGDNDLRLVLYAAVDGGADTVIRDLREHLRQRLPAYMLPQHIEALPELPKTPNGKIDRKALPMPTAAAAIGQLRTTGAGSAGSGEATMTDPRELYIADLWRELIGVSEIRRSDNFLDLGGHSLLAVQFANRVRRETGVSLQLLNVATGTLATLAAELPGLGAASPTATDESLWSRLRRRLGGS
jgi:amino acid adenylation domain-containing protein